MALTGYNESEVISALNNINKHYGFIIKALSSDNQDKFVVPMSNAWACKEAQDFFGKYQAAISQLVQGVNKTFESLSNSMNGAASKLAMAAGTTWSERTLVTVNTIVDSSVIKDNINGVRGIDMKEASNVLSQLDTLLSQLTNELDSVIQAVSNSGFVGGSMQEILVSSLETIKSNIETAFGDIKTDANTYIQETLTKYSTDVTRIESAFSGEE